MESDRHLGSNSAPPPTIWGTLDCSPSLCLLLCDSPGSLTPYLSRFQQKRGPHWPGSPKESMQDSLHLAGNIKANDEGCHCTPNLTIGLEEQGVGIAQGNGSWGGVGCSYCVVRLQSRKELEKHPDPSLSDLLLMPPKRSVSTTNHPARQPARQCRLRGHTWGSERTEGDWRSQGSA